MDIAKLSRAEKAKLKEVAKKLGVKWPRLFHLIEFESRWNTTIKNPLSSARGIIQWIDKTARGLGYSSSLDLIKKNPTRIQQLEVVYHTLKIWKPFPTNQSLYMAVFYPKYRYAHPDKIFPSNVLKSNPGIRTPRDYINFIEKLIPYNYIGIGSILLITTIIGGLYYGTKQKEKGFFS